MDFFRNAKRTETMMTVSRHSLKQMKKTVLLVSYGIDKLLTPSMEAYLVSQRRSSWLLFRLLVRGDVCAEKGCESQAVVVRR